MSRAEHLKLHMLVGFGHLYVDVISRQEALVGHADIDNLIAIRDFGEFHNHHGLRNPGFVFHCRDDLVGVVDGGFLNGPAIGDGSEADKYGHEIVGAWGNLNRRLVGIMLVGRNVESIETLGELHAPGAVGGGLAVGNHSARHRMRNHHVGVSHMRCLGGIEGILVLDVDDEHAGSV